MNISDIILERLLSDQYTNNITFPTREHQNIKIDTESITGI